MFWVVAGIIGVLSGLIASITFFLLLCKIKPVVVISDDICRDLHDDLFRIKVVNKSKFDLIDVKYSLYACYRSGDGTIDVKEICPVKSKLEFVHSYSPSGKSSDYAIRISYKLTDYINEKYNCFLFTFYSKHSLSGTGSFIRKEYTKDNIKCGKFQLKESTEIIMESCHRTYQNCDNCIY